MIDVGDSSFGKCQNTLLVSVAPCTRTHPDDLYRRPAPFDEFWTGDEQHCGDQSQHETTGPAGDEIIELISLADIESFRHATVVGVGDCAVQHTLDGGN